MKITEATFAGSSTNLDGRPDKRLPEVAFIGRSNVGKSSLINMLCGSRKLALTSSEPGKTRLVNHFLINRSWYIVDLPGYGFAKMSMAERQKMTDMINSYLLGSRELQLLFVLLDSRHDLMKIDMDFIDRLGENGIPFAIAFTKGDKLGPVALQKQIDKDKTALLEHWEYLPACFATSAISGMGREEILEYIDKVLDKNQ
ncbi:MAG: ribosome biogenesis GTP-binding protein YihA/YsxC [Bacteroidales bacterium]|nr:ribosome biogenesis GTP-binding protein YihA/YsxC [Bacteroidales bacterium]